MFRSHHEMCGGGCSPGMKELSEKDQQAFLEKKEKILEAHLEFIRKQKESLAAEQSSSGK